MIIQLFIDSKQSIVMYMLTVWQYVLIRVVFCFGSSRKALKAYQLLIVWSFKFFTYEWSMQNHEIIKLWSLFQASLLLFWLKIFIIDLI